MRDRLRELALAPWGDAAGDGALLRLAAARAAVQRLLAATPAMDALAAPDLVVVSGGAWAVAPAAGVALAVADVIRRPGVRALGFDHARLLGPLGTIPDPAERRLILDDLRDEVVLPLGSVVMPAGLRAGGAGGPAGRARAGRRGAARPRAGQPRAGRPAGRGAGHASTSRSATRSTSGRAVRHAAVEVTGGLAGLLVDLRDVPIRIPDRLELRREALAGWQADVWAGSDA